MFKQPIVVLDFETTGLSPDSGDRVTEVAALRIVKDRVVEKFVSLINCQVTIPSFISSLTGISQAMLNKAPKATSVMPELKRFIGNDILAAHNASFDLKFLQAENQRLGLCTEQSKLLCSLKLSRRVFPGLSSYKLTQLSESLGLNFKSKAHRAEADAEVTAQLIIYISQHLGNFYRFTSLDPQILVNLTSIPAAKSATYLAQQFLRV